MGLARTLTAYALAAVGLLTAATMPASAEDKFLKSQNTVAAKALEQRIPSSRSSSGIEGKTQAPGYRLFTLSSEDQTRRTLYNIVMNYCDVNAVTRFYRTGRNLNRALRKLARQNGIRRVSAMSEGTLVRIPVPLLKKDLPQEKQGDPQRPGTQKPGKQAQRARRFVAKGYQSPFGGRTKPAEHYCFDLFPQNWRAGKRRVCPSDLYGARRSGGRRKHKGLDLYGKVGTALYPLMPGTVIGAGYMLEQDGKRKRFRHWRNNGRAVKIRADDGTEFTYIHLNKVNVKIGQKVGYDTQLGELGVHKNPYKQNPHVHVSVYKDGEPVDPMEHLGFLK
jgi:murein DD-endopeptidase MepM/ murein hydrolase activator NlpD